LTPCWASASKSGGGERRHIITSYKEPELLSTKNQNIVTNFRGSLKPEMIDKLVCLRVNKIFMEFCREKKSGGVMYNHVHGISNVE